jgi:hypothetical protein
MHGESYVTYCGKGEYVIDTSKFPELDGKSEQEVVQWLYENQESVGVNSDYIDDDPNKHSYNDYDKAYEIVPLEEDDDESPSLYDYTSDSSVVWDKIKNEEDYFRLLYDIDKRKMSSEEIIKEIEQKNAERIKNGEYNI